MSQATKLAVVGDKLPNSIRSTLSISDDNVSQYEDDADFYNLCSQLSSEDSQIQLIILNFPMQAGRVLNYAQSLGEITDVPILGLTQCESQSTAEHAQGTESPAIEEAEWEGNRIIERVTDAVVEIDSDWRFTMVSNRAEEIYGIEETELLGKHFWDVFEWGVGTVFEEKYREVMETREPTSFEARYDGEDDPSGLHGWFEVHVYPQQDDGIAFYFRDITQRKRRETRSEHLKAVLTEFMDATSKEEIADIVVDAADPELSLPVTVVALYDEVAGKLYPQARTALAEQHLDVSALLEHGTGQAWNVFIDGEAHRIRDPGPEAFSGDVDIDEFVCYPLAQHGVLIAGIHTQDAEFVTTLAENLRTSLDRVHSDLQLQEREERLQEQNDSLTRLRRINDVIRNIDQVLVGATSREEIQQAVCDELVSSEAYDFVWYGVYEASAETIVPCCWAGGEKGFLNTVSSGPPGDAATKPPVWDAVQSREPRVMNNVLANPPFEDWQKAALNRGFHSNIALPIRYKGSLYGVLDIHSRERNTFDEMEQEVLIELSNTIAYAINAVESKKALVSDTVLDLELHCNPSSHPFFEFLDEDRDRAIDLNGIVPTEKGAFRIYVSFQNAATEAVVDLLQSCVDVAHYKPGAAHGAGQEFEIIVSEESLVKWLLDRGAIPRSMSIDGSRGRLHVELFGDVGVREFVEQFQEQYPNAELAASRERERSLYTRDTFLSSFEAALSDRQQEVLKTAYLSGYFETPRKQNATEIADSLDIAQPTFSTHLRSGLRNLFSLIYEQSQPK